MKIRIVPYILILCFVSISIANAQKVNDHNIFKRRFEKNGAYSGISLNNNFNQKTPLRKQDNIYKSNNLGEFNEIPGLVNKRKYYGVFCI